MSNIFTMSYQLLLAGFLGAAVGYEREIHERPAGLRTHILVCMGAALITIVSMSFIPKGGDGSRIAAQIVSGIGFLGAGTILRQGSIVRGLTTAASLWTVAGIGMAVGIGGVYLALAVIATLIVFITLSSLRHFEPALGKRQVREVYLEMAENNVDCLADVLKEMVSRGVSVQSITSVETTARKRAFDLMIAVPHNIEEDVIVGMLSSKAGLDRFEWS